MTVRHRGKRQALIENQRGVRLIFAARRVRNQRYGTDAQHLRGREYDEHDIARGADARERGISQSRHEVQVDEKVPGLKKHTRRDRQRHLQDVPDDRTVGQILHRQPPPSFGMSAIVP